MRQFVPLHVETTIFRSYANTLRRDIIRPRGYIKISASLFANMDPYAIPHCARAFNARCSFNVLV